MRFLVAILILIALAGPIQGATWWGGWGNFSQSATLSFISNGVTEVTPFATNTESYSTVFLQGPGISRSITFSCSNTNVCNVDSTTGQLTFNSFGTNTIIAALASTPFGSAFSITQSVIFSAIPWIYSTNSTLTFTQSGTLAFAGAASITVTNTVIDAKQLIAIITSGSNTQVYSTSLTQGDGISRSISSWTSTSTNVCSVSDFGVLSFVSPGTSTIVVAFSSTPNNEPFSVTQSVIFTSTPASISSNITYEANTQSYNYNIAVCNTNDPSSIAIFECFTNTFPQSRTVLLGTVTNHSVSASEWVSQVWTPLTNAISTNVVRYVTLCGDFPFMVGVYSVQTAYGNINYRGKTNIFSIAEYGSAPLFTYITGFTTNDAFALIYRGTNTLPSATSLLWYYDDKGSGGWTVAYNVSNTLVNIGIPSTNILWAMDRPTGFTTLPPKNLASFLTWGNVGGVGNSWASNGSYTVSGTNNAYIAQSIESWNWGSQRLPSDTIANQKSMRHLLAPWAFGGSNYIRSPVGCVGHVFEPDLSGIHNPNILNGNWARGLWLVEVGASSAQSGKGVTVGVPGAHLSP